MQQAHPDTITKGHLALFMESQGSKLLTVAKSYPKKLCPIEGFFFKIPLKHENYKNKILCTIQKTPDAKGKSFMSMNCDM